MRIGYINDKNSSIEKELDFCKRNFDYCEITIFRKDVEDYLRAIKKSKLQSSRIIAHFDWSYNLCLKDDIAEMQKLLSRMSGLKIKKYVIHLPIEAGAKKRKLFENLDALADFAQKRGIKIFFENNSTGYFSKIENVRDVVSGKPNIGFALDVAHAGIKSAEELTEINDILKINHIHFSSSKNGIDHLPLSQEQIQDMHKGLKKLSAPITLEIFHKMSDGKRRLDLGVRERKKIIVALKKSIQTCL